MNSNPDPKKRDAVAAMNALAKAKHRAGQSTDALPTDCNSGSHEERRLQTARLATVARFASQMAHQIRNPLNSISLNLELLEDEIKDSGTEAQNLIHSILKEMERLNEVVTSYVECARVPKTNLKLGRVECVVQKLAAEYKVPPRISIQWTLSTETPEVWMDEVLLKRVLGSLIENGIEAMPGEGTVDVETELLDGFVAVHVRDSGTGIEPEARNKLFEPFITTKPQGTGLALATSQQVVFEHHGHLFVDTQPGKGSTFSVLLPI